MIIKNFDDMRLGTIPLNKLYYGHDLIWKKEGSGNIIDKKISSVYLTNYSSTCMDISPNGRFIVSVVESITSALYDNMFILQITNDNLYVKQRIKRNGKHTGIMFSKDGEYLFGRVMATSGNSVSSFVYKITGTSFNVDETMRSKFHSVLDKTDRFRFSRDGNYLIAKNNYQVRFIKYTNGEFTLLNEEVTRVTNYTSYPSRDSMCISSDGTYGVIGLYGAFNGLGDVYKRTNENYSFYTTLLPSSLVGSCSKFSPNDKFLAFGRDSAYTSDALLVIFKNDDGNFTRIANIDIMPNSSIRDITFSNDSKYMYVLMGVSPFVMIYKIDGETFKKMPDPIDLPNSSVGKIAISLDDKYVAILGTYAELYETTR